MKRKVLVTGGAGFIASHVVDSYLENNYDVAVIDDLSSGNKNNLNDRAKFFQVNILDLKEVEKAIQEFQPNIINHHAAHLLVGDSVNNPQFNAQVNIIGMLNVIESAKKWGLEKIVMASTGGAMYGEKPLPFKESMDPDPLSPYGVSKRACEIYLNYYFHQYNIPYTILRYANVYGPRQESSTESGVIAIFSSLLKEGKQPIINGDGEQTRDFVYVSDVVRAIMMATSIDFNGAINIGTNTGITINELFDKLTAAFNLMMERKYGPDRPGEQRTSRLDYSLATQVLGWEPTTNLNEGLVKTTDWYRYHE